VGKEESLVGGEWKAPLSGNFAWDWWSVGGIVTVGIADVEDRDIGGHSLWIDLNSRHLIILN
jgi:hypothetical protein